jgi:triacylglycerol lipase
VARLMAKIGADKCHLVAHSFTGIDARAAISLFDSDKQVSSLTTICTPHQGMTLIDKANDKQWLGTTEGLERVFEVLGISNSAVQEFTTHNIQAFNEVCHDSQSVSYFSIGAKKSGRTMNAMLRDGHDIIVNDTMGVQCDGLVQDIEARWGEYLLTFENDHLEVMGFCPEHNPANVMNVVSDNTRLSEIRSDPKLRYDFGVDHL